MNATFTPRRLALYALAGLIALALGYAFLPPREVVDVVPVKIAPLQITVDEEGKTRVIDRFSVSAPVAGLMRRIDLKVGDSVKRGQAIAEIEARRSPALDPRSRAEADSRLAAAGASLKAAEAKLQATAASADLATADLQRSRRLQQAGFVSRALLERAEEADQSAAAARRSARFALDVARYEKETARAAAGLYGDKGQGETLALRSPVDGRVLKIERQSEGPVAEGQPLLEIGDPRALEVDVEVLSTDAVQLKPGMPVRFERWGGGLALDGKVSRIEPAGFTKISALGVEEQRVHVIADLVSPSAQWQSLGDGFRVEARFILWRGERVLQIPSSALFRDGKSWAVFVAERGRARRRFVEIGQHGGLAAEVRSGLKAGERVIPYPGDRLSDGARIKIR
ncbi:MAG: efflux RND transporter periplasmic adaptor subunit [Burkholderiales bacterium]